MTYTLTCPVCRVSHTKDAWFLSGPRTIVAISGVPGLAYTCGNHTADELRAAR